MVDLLLIVEGGLLIGRFPINNQKINIQQRINNQ
jgi:hypothetical protein